MRAIEGIPSQPMKMSCPVVRERGKRREEEER
jgi:hypothetical protein